MSVERFGPPISYGRITRVPTNSAACDQVLNKTIPENMMVRRRELIPAFEENPPLALSVDMLFPEGPSPPRTPPVPVLVVGLKVLGVVPVVVPGVLGVVVVPGVLGVVVVGVEGVVLVPAALELAGYEHPALLGSDALTVAVPAKSQACCCCPFLW